MSNATSASGNNPSAKRARDTLSRIYSWYLVNRDSLERTPSFVSTISNSSREIVVVALSHDIPPEHQLGDLQQELKELTKTQEAIDALSKVERDLMLQAAQSTHSKRNANKNPTG